MPINKPLTRLAAQQAGFTLIEVMISLLILAFGMLGMTALQNEALKFNHAAFIDSQAQFLLTDMAERIRANRGNSAYQILFTQPTPSVITNCATGPCSPNDIAVYDINQWRSKVTNTAILPNGESNITYDTTTKIFTISIRYDWSNLGGVDVTGGKRTISITTRI
jgi:type IV pilus assembly protein PilV